MKRRAFMLISCLLLLLTLFCGCVDGRGDDPDNAQSEQPNDENGAQKNDPSDPYENDREWNL